MPYAPPHAGSTGQQHGLADTAEGTAPLVKPQRCDGTVGVKTRPRESQAGRWWMIGRGLPYCGVGWQEHQPKCPSRLAQSSRVCGNGTVLQSRTSFVLERVGPVVRDV